MKGLKKKTKLNVREIVFCNEEEKSFCDIFIYEPENIEEQALGNLYIIGEVANLPSNSSYLLNLLASIIKKEFYSKSKRSTMESLEASLYKANSTLSDFVEHGNIDWIGNLNMSCGTYNNGEFHLSQVGKIKTLLIREGQITDIGKDINKEDGPHPFKTFANIASGELEINDMILFATPVFFNIFSLKKLKQLTSSLDFNDLANEIQSSIEKEENINIVGALIMKIEKEEKEEGELRHIKIKSDYQEKQKEQVELSLARNQEIKNNKENPEKEIIETNKEMQKNESPIIGNAQKISLANIIEEYEKTGVENEDKYDSKEIVTEETEKEEEIQELEIKTQKPEQESLENKKLEDKENNGNATVNTEIFDTTDEKEKVKINIIKNVLKKVLSAIKYFNRKIIDLLIVHTKKISGKLNDVTFDNSENKIVELKKIGLTKKNKLLLITFALVFLMLAWNIISTNYQKKELERIKPYENSLLQAQEKLDKANEVLIYKDNEQAKIFLIEARNLLEKMEEIKDKHPELNKNAIALLEEIQKNLDEIDLVQKIENPKIIIDLSSIENLKNPEQVIKINENYYVFTTANSSIYEIDLISGEAKSVYDSNNSFNGLKFSTPINKINEIAFITNSDEIAMFDLDKKELNAQNIKITGNIGDVKDISSYSNYIYLLNPIENQIYKHQKISDGFKDGEPWFNETDLDIKNAVSMTIDKTIYILKSDGTVEKYLTGSKEEFSIISPSTPIVNPTEIYTNNNIKSLYVVDPIKNRIAIFDKSSGSLVGQYISKDFNNLKNIIVDDKEEKMYVLSGYKIFEIELNSQE